MKSLNERKSLLQKIARLEHELKYENQKNKILQEHADRIDKCQSEYEKLIGEAKAEIKSAKEMRAYFERLGSGLEADLLKLQA